MNKKAPSANRSRQRATALAAAAVLAVVVTWAWSQRKASGEESTFRTVSVERGDIRVAISATGTLSATSTVVVGSQVSGQVTDVLVDFNDRVARGQVIARIDPSSYEAQIAQGAAQIASARAALKQAEAALRNADADHARKAGLAVDGLVARSDLDVARSARDQAEAQVNSARAQISQQTAGMETARINLARTVIRSPVDGVVLTRSIEPGQTVAASLQAPELFTIAEDLGQMKIVLAVDEADIGQVAVGQAVNFTADAFADRQFRGTVQQVRLSATTTSNVVTYPVVVAVDNRDGTLLPGLTVNAEIEVSRREDVLKVSNAALRYKPTGAQAEARGAQPAGNRGAGMLEDMQGAAARMQLNGEQRSAFDEAMAAVRERQAARTAAPQGGNANRVFGGGGGGSGPRVAPGGGNMPAQMRQRMTERFQQDFADFRASLDDRQRAAWDATMTDMVSARRAPLYRLEDGAPRLAMVRIGASDGTSTEIAGGIAAGDLVVTGERAAQ
jgi:HlyD family secretion protein